METVLGCVVQDWKDGRLTDEAAETAASAYLHALHLGAHKRLQLEPERLQLTQLAINEYDKLPALINDFVEKMRELGPNPYKGL